MVCGNVINFVFLLLSFRFSMGSVQNAIGAFVKQLLVVSSGKRKASVQGKGPEIPAEPQLESDGGEASPDREEGGEASPAALAYAATPRGSSSHKKKPRRKASVEDVCFCSIVGKP